MQRKRPATQQQKSRPQVPGSRHISMKFRSAYLLTLTFSYIGNHEKVKRLITLLSKKGRQFIIDNVSQLQYFCSHNDENSTSYNSSAFETLQLKPIINWFENLKLVRIQDCLHLKNNGTLNGIENIKQLEFEARFDQNQTSIDPSDLQAAIRESLRVKELMECMQILVSKSKNLVIHFSDKNQYTQNIFHSAQLMKQLESVSIDFLTSYNDELVSKFRFLENVKNLSLSIRQQNQLEQFLKSAFFPKKKNSDQKWNSTGYIPSNLTSLNLYEMETIDMEFLEKLPQLESLQVEKQQFDFGVIQLHLPHLRKLSLQAHEFKVGEIEPNRFYQLVELNLKGFNNDNDKIEIPKILRAVPNLTRVCIQNIKLSSIKELQVASNLEELTLESLQFNTEIFNSICTFKQLRKCKLIFSMSDFISYFKTGKLSCWNNYSIQKMTLQCSQNSGLNSEKQMKIVQDFLIFFGYLKSLKKLSMPNEPLNQSLQSCFIKRLMLLHPNLHLKLPEIEYFEDILSKQPKSLKIQNYINEKKFSAFIKAFKNNSSLISLDIKMQDRAIEYLPVLLQSIKNKKRLKNLKITHNFTYSDFQRHNFEKLIVTDCANLTQLQFKLVFSNLHQYFRTHQFHLEELQRYRAELSEIVKEKLPKLNIFSF